MRDDEGRAGFWRRWWWIYPVFFGGAGIYQLLTGIDSGRWGPPAVGVPLLFAVAVGGGWYARSGRLDRR